MTEQHWGPTISGDIVIIGAGSAGIGLVASLPRQYLCNTCHCRACPSCGQKATDQWIANQYNRLPDCPWQHLVFTLPDTLWPLFFHNRH